MKLLYGLIAFVVLSLVSATTASAWWWVQPSSTPSATPTEEPSPTISEVPTVTGQANVEPYQGENTTVTCDTSVPGHEQYCGTSGLVTDAPHPIEGPRTVSAGPSGTELPNTGSGDLFIFVGLALIALGTVTFIRTRRRLQK